MGRPRKHALLHALDGTAEPHRHDLCIDSLLSPGECRPTRELGEHASKLWAVHIAALPAGIFGASEAETLTTACEWAQKYHDLQTSYGSDVDEWAPRIKLFSESSDKYLRALEKLGLTPTTKGKLKADKPVPKDSPEQTYFGVTG